MSAVTLSVDGVRVSVPRGSTVLDAVRAAGAAVPTLCHLKGRPPQSACGVCVVEAMPGRLVPSCSCPAEDGMEILTASPAAASARRAAMALLLSEHSGDCRAPCARACPAGLDVMGAVRLMEAGDMQGALALVLETLPFPGLMAASCAGYCERMCRRAGLDSPLGIRAMHAEMDRAEADGARAGMVSPEASPESSAGSVTIRGDGLSALSAAFFLMRGGFAVTVSGDCLDALRVSPSFTPRIAAALERELRILELAGCRFGVPAAGAAPGGGTPDRVMELRPAEAEWRVPARAVARGRLAALSFMGGAGSARRPFETVITDVSKEELAALEAGERAGAHLRPAGGRCLSCGCPKEKGCRLRLAAEGMGADRGRFPGRRIPVRRRVVAMGTPALVVEPGKCIRCGICVRLSAGTRFPLQFIGRGFTVEVGGFESYGRPECAAAFRKIAAECPTGCLSWEERNA